MKKVVLLFSVLGLLVTMALAAQPWHAATAAELHQVLPARAHVGKEHIELEWRAATGVTNGAGGFIAGAPLITAGYAAHSKFSRYLVTKTAIEVGGKRLAPGAYVIGLREHGKAPLEVLFFTAVSEHLVARVNASLAHGDAHVVRFAIEPPHHGMGAIRIGRFTVPFHIAG